MVYFVPFVKGVVPFLKGDGQLVKGADSLKLLSKLAVFPLLLILRIFGKKTAKISAIFNENFEIRERCKGVHCVDLGESFPTSIYLQNLASIQPRTSLFNFD